MFCLPKDRVLFIFIKYKKVTFTTECAHNLYQIHEWLTMSKIFQKYSTLHMVTDREVVSIYVNVLNVNLADITVCSKHASIILML